MDLVLVFLCSLAALLFRLADLTLTLCMPKSGCLSLLTPNASSYSALFMYTLYHNSNYGYAGLFLDYHKPCYNISMRLFIITASIIISLFGFAGGGGSSSGGGGGGGGGGSHSSSSSSRSSGSSSGGSSCEGEGCVFEIIYYVIIFGVIGLVVYFSQRNTKKRNFNRGYNKTPQEKMIRQEAERIFKAYQEDWGAFNLKNIATYTTPQYYQHATLMLEALKNLNRANIVSNLKVPSVDLQQPVNDKTSLPANVSVIFQFSGKDEVVDTSTGERLYSANAEYASETWNFIYDGKTLKLDGISQPTESSGHLVKSLAEFSAQNKLYYSPDWGRYALPSRGMIFGGSSMTKSDVNNHVIGKWGDLLVQLYTYSEIPGDPGLYYIVGQISVPKKYLGVIVKSKHKRLKATKNIDKTYDKFELEWPDFNNRYEIYAAKADALPAFELLNPKFMEYLYSKNPNYSLEVADNSIYIFANISTVSEQDYADLLDILAMAYKELKQ